MKKFFYPFFLCCLTAGIATAQINILSTNPIAEEVMRGNYDVNDYLPSQPLPLPEDIASAIHDAISPDSLKAYLIALSSFQTRNTASDTLSATRGIGAARRWAHSKFADFSQRAEGRLIPSYLQFDRDVCGVIQHRNVFAVLPGTDPNDHSVLIIEGHMDSRCDQACDVDCQAEGSEDNATGTALVIELARVMSQLAFNKTVIFMATTGEEQGLVGAEAFALYAVQKDIDIKAVLNNDVVGGIICGETSSPPSCPGLNDIDSTQVRLFSSGSQNSRNKALARYIKLQYKEMLLPLVNVPMLLTLMSAEDRTGRGGDHIPFREHGFAAMRFTSANEHGNANASDPDYHDRQHTSDDILGVDTDGDQVIDSFFVDFNYLSRNTAINGVAAAMIGISPEVPTFDSEESGGVVTVTVNDPFDYNHYRLGVRTDRNDFDTLITFQGTKTVVYGAERFGFHYLSVTAVNDVGVESCFSEEKLFIITTVGIEEAEPKDQVLPIELGQNRPNPFDEATHITYVVKEPVRYSEAFIRITDMQGRELERIAAPLELGANEVLYTHGYHTVGTFLYSLVVDGHVVDTKPMVFAY